MDGKERDLERYAERLRELPFVRSVSVAERGVEVAGARLDARLVLDTPEGRADLLVALARTTLTRRLAEHMITLSRKVPHLMVLAPAVGKDLADLFAEQRVDFVDLAGNCHVHVDERYFARVQGRRHPARRAAARSLRAPAHRVLFALLANPDLARATARTLATAAGGVSPQTANDARKRLAVTGDLVAARSGYRWMPGGWDRTLDLFLVGYPSLAASFEIGRYRSRHRDPEQVEAELVPALDALGRWRWGGGAAGWRLGRHYRGDRTLVYLEHDRRISTRAVALPPDPRGNVVLVGAPGPLALEGPRPDCVHPILVYADLLGEGHDRAREAAAEIHDRFLSPIAEAAA